MLQQTTVKAVVPYYERFIERFPTIMDVANASEEEVLKYWEGLGYYSRGRSLHQAALMLVEQFDGIFPRDLKQLQQLPGIGRYTAGAIRSFAFNLPAPIVEANTLRLYCRLLGFDGDPRSKAGQGLLWEFAEAVQPPRTANHLNQALMELGSLICRPQEPDCPNCPIAMNCRAFANGTQGSIPVKKERPQVTNLVDATVAIISDGKFLVQQRQSKERWAGMWDFPRCELTDVPFKGDWSSLSSNIEDQFREEFSELKLPTGKRRKPFELIKEFRHSVTRYRIRLLCFRIDIPKVLSLDEPFRWVRLAELDELPMPVTARKFVEALKQV